MYRDRRTLLLIVPLVAFFLVATSLCLNREYVSRVVLPKLHIPSVGKAKEATAPEEATPIVLLSSIATVPSVTPTPTPTPLPEIVVGNGSILVGSTIHHYVDAILDPNVTTFERLPCPAINETRYASLKSLGGSDAGDAPIDFFFALNLRNNLPLLPRLIGSILEVIEFLGKQRCAISIVEGISPDGTGDVLKALEPFLDRMGVRYYYSTSEIDSKKGNRIEKLALLRNLALEPLLDLFNSTASANTTVIFLNDVAACPEDILELTLQRQALGADMTCGMDWFSGGDEPTFYDVWISRSINGDSFFQIPLSGSWEFALDLFWDDPETKARFEAHQPFQVYSCWNGAAVFSAAPLVEGVRFRDSAEGHCKHGEPQNFCKDLWSTGYGKIAVIPTVNLEYSNDKGLLIKELKGYVTDAIVQGEGDEEIEWIGPPAEVRCIEDWAHQFWKPWELSRRDLPDRQ